MSKPDSTTTRKNAEAYDSGKKTPKGKGKQPTTAGLSAPTRRREAETKMEEAVKAYVKAALEEGINGEQIRASVDAIAYDSLTFE